MEFQKGDGVCLCTHCSKNRVGFHQTTGYERWKLNEIISYNAQEMLQNINKYTDKKHREKTETCILHSPPDSKRTMHTKFAVQTFRLCNEAN